MTAFHHAVVRIERMVEDAWHRVHLPTTPEGHWHFALPDTGSFHFPHVATRASECALPMASALMVAGCIGSTDPTTTCACPTDLGGSGGDQPGGGQVATASAHVPDEDDEESFERERAVPFEVIDPEPTPAPVPPPAAARGRRAEEPCDDETPWYYRGRRPRRELSEAIEQNPQEVLPQLQQPGTRHSVTPPAAYVQSPGGIFHPGL